MDCFKTIVIATISAITVCEMRDRLTDKSTVNCDMLRARYIIVADPAYNSGVKITAGQNFATVSVSDGDFGVASLTAEKSKGRVWLGD